MKKILMALAVVVMLLISLTSWGPTEREKAARELGIDLSGCATVSLYDTHSGNGDGVSCQVLSLEGRGFQERLRGDRGWSPLPLDDTAQALVYGLEKGDAGWGPYLTDGAGEPLVPEIREGYYCLVDRQPEEYREECQNILERHSFNLTVGLYDTETDILYICRFDT